MKNLIIILFVTVMFTLPASAVTYPHLALGGGYECVVIVTNRLETEFDGGLFLLKGNRENWDEPFLANGEPNEKSTVNFSVPPLGSKKILLQSTSELEVGYVDIRAYGDSLEEDVIASFFYQYRVNGRLVDSVGVPASELSDGHFFPVEISTDTNTGFAWARFSALDPFDITLTLYDDEGQVFGQKTVTFMGHSAQFITEVFEDVPDGFVGHLRIVSDNQIAMVALRFEQLSDGFQLTSTPVEHFIP